LNPLNPTTRIYYTDPYAAEFEAGVLAIEDAAGQRGVVLDRTAFYPTSGGQPFDVGVLGDARVLDVIDRDDGSILHVVDRDPVASDGGRVRGRVDWMRRFDHMQQHTGQHVLSAAFARLLDVATLSFHLGSSSSTIDLAREVSSEEIARAQTAANQVVWENRPVTIRFADAAEAATLSLRKEPARDGLLRLITIEDFDVSACGGTHVSRTGAIGIIAVAGWERFRGGTRIEFLCGTRALQGYRALRDTVAASMRLLSVGAGEIASAIERAQEESKDLRRHVKDLQGRLASFVADALASEAAPERGMRAVVAALDGWDANGVKTIAASIAARPGHAAILFGLPAPSPIVVARAPDVALDSAAVLKQLTARFGGKGGGRPELAQGGGLQGAQDEMISAARAVLASVSGG
jgi:alanyl-tRNA synthetase